VSNLCENVPITAAQRRRHGSHSDESEGAATVGIVRASSRGRVELGGGGGVLAAVLVFTIAKTGLMYEASVGGQKFKFTPLK
jgi:hypothetical protein